MFYFYKAGLSGGLRLQYLLAHMQDNVILKRMKADLAIKTETVKIKMKCVLLQQQILLPRLPGKKNKQINRNQREAGNISLHE